MWINLPTVEHSSTTFHPHYVAVEAHAVVTELLWSCVICWPVCLLIVATCHWSQSTVVSLSRGNPSSHSPSLHLVARYFWVFHIGVLSSLLVISHVPVFSLCCFIICCCSSPRVILITLSVYFICATIYFMKWCVFYCLLYWPVHTYTDWTLQFNIISTVTNLMRFTFQMWDMFVQGRHSIFLDHIRMSWLCICKRDLI